MLERVDLRYTTRRFGHMRYCAAPGCPQLVTAGRCPTHARQQHHERPTAHVRGYSYRWAQYATQFRHAHPICGERADGTLDSRYSRCLQQGLTTPSTCVDHIIPLVQNGPLWDPLNHVALCHSCNTWKAATLERRR